MSLFLRLLEDEDKPETLRTALRAAGAAEPRVFEADSDAFVWVPGRRLRKGQATDAGAASSGRL